MPKVNNKDIYPIKETPNVLDFLHGVDSETGKDASFSIGTIAGQGNIVTATSVVTETVTGHKIAKHNDGNNTVVNINETITKLELLGNELTYTKEDGNNDVIDLSDFLDDTNLARIVSAELNQSSGIVTFERNDSSTFTLNLSTLLNVQADWEEANVNSPAYLKNKPTLNQQAKVISVNIGGWDMTANSSVLVDVYNELQNEDLTKLLNVNTIIFDDNVDINNNNFRGKQFFDLSIGFSLDLGSNVASVSIEIENLKTGSYSDTTKNRGKIVFTFLP